MPLSSFFQRFRQMASSGRGGAPEAAHVSPSDVEAARVRARRRLIGMVVLVGAGVIGFPWLFETQPRPMSQDVEMVHAGIGGDEGLSVARGAASRTASGRVAVAGIVPPPDDEAPEREARTSRARRDGDGDARETISSRPPASPKAERGTEPRSEAKPEARPEARSTPRPPAKPDAKPDTKEAAKADKPADKAAADKPGSRYVVQFGAFADAGAARTARAKVEKLGVKTYAQQVDTPAGKRIRVRIGPYADKAEADKALATLRKAGLAGAVLTL